MTKQAKSPEMEWSVFVRAEDVPPNGKTLEITPNPKEKKALAKRLDVLSVEDLSAKVQLKRDTPHIVHVTGVLEAIVKKSCVVTLEPIDIPIKEEFEGWYADESQAVSFRRAQHEAQSKKDLLDIPMLDESEDPEPMVNGQIDVGDLATQYLSLAIPLYPVKEGVELKASEPDVQKGNPMKVNPFAALKDWRPKD